MTTLSLPFSFPSLPNSEGLELSLCFSIQQGFPSFNPLIPTHAMSCIRWGMSRGRVTPNYIAKHLNQYVITLHLQTLNFLYTCYCQPLSLSRRTKGCLGSSSAYQGIPKNKLAFKKRHWRLLQVQIADLNEVNDKNPTFAESRFLRKPNDLNNCGIEIASPLILNFFTHLFFPLSTHTHSTKSKHIK